MEVTKEFNLRAEYYTSLCEKEYSKYPKTFKEFVQDFDAIKEGDLLLTSRLSKGYNYAKEEDFPLNSDKPVIIYNNYIQRTDHFGTVLAKMEGLGLIAENSYGFGAKATKVVGKWGDPEPITKQVNISNKNEDISESVEGCLIFFPKNIIQAIEIAKFLGTNAIKRDGSPFINGSWDIPDIRSSKELEALNLAGFKEVYANKLPFKNGDLITLKIGNNEIKIGWSSRKIMVHELLYDFI